MSKKITPINIDEIHDAQEDAQKALQQCKQDYEAIQADTDKYQKLRAPNTDQHTGQQASLLDRWCEARAVYFASTAAIRMWDSMYKPGASREAADEAVRKLFEDTARNHANARNEASLASYKLLFKHTRQDLAKADKLENDFKKEMTGMRNKGAMTRREFWRQSAAHTAIGAAGLGTLGYMAAVKTGAGPITRTKLTGISAGAGALVGSTIGMMNVPTSATSLKWSDWKFQAFQKSGVLEADHHAGEFARFSHQLTGFYETVCHRELQAAKKPIRKDQSDVTEYLGDLREVIDSLQQSATNPMLAKSLLQYFGEIEAHYNQAQEALGDAYKMPYQDAAVHLQMYTKATDELRAATGEMGMFGELLQQLEVHAGNAKNHAMNVVNGLNEATSQLQAHVQQALEQSANLSRYGVSAR